MATNEDLEELKGVGSATADKLSDAGYGTVKSIAVASPAELSDSAGIGDNTASKIIRAARNEADIGGFEKGTEVLQRRKDIGKIKTLVPEVDELLGGGIETQSITEAYGEFGSGKSQITHQLSINVQLPEELGGLGRSAIFIDTEDTFRPERIDQMVRGLGDDTKQEVMDRWGIEGGIDDEDAMEELVEEFLSNIHRATAYNSDHQILLTERSKELAGDLEETDFPLGLIIVDSLTAHFRAEYMGRGNLANRQQKLNKHLHDILRVSNLNNAAALVTNQVQSNPDAMFGDPTRPIGGNVLGHTSTFRIYIRKSKKDKRIIKLVDAPNLPDGEAVMRIKEEGLKPE